MFTAELPMNDSRLLTEPAEAKDSAKEGCGKLFVVKVARVPPFKRYLELTGRRNADLARFVATEDEIKEK